jgi:ribonuclease BN (tRNA processing enzyme)
MKVHAHGVRGSYPVPGSGTVRYGGNTTCFSVTKEADGRIVRVIIDMGTGFIALGKEILANYFAGREGLTLTILNSHLHPDHTQGFPFFAPNFFKDSSMHFLGMETLKKNLGHALADIMDPPKFPIELRDLKTKKTFTSIGDGSEFFIQKTGAPSNTKDANSVFGVRCMKAHAPSHPQQGAVYYRITDLETGRSVCTIWDLESHVGGDQRVIQFSKGTELMIHDTMYTEEEYRSPAMVVQGFGHSTYGMAIDNAVAAGAKALLCMHFNPSHTDGFLDSLKNEVRAMAALASDSLPVDFAVEGQTYTI